MWAAGDEAGTVAYSPWWWVLAIALLVLTVSWNFGLLIWGRPRRAASSPRVQLPRPAKDYLSRIDQIQAAHAAGALSTRKAHQELTSLVRQYAQEHTGVPASSMTLRELEASDLDEVAGVAGVVGMAYRPSFAPLPEEGVDLGSVIAAARSVVGDRT